MLPELSQPPECVSESGSWCQQVWTLTGNEWLAGSAEWLVAKPLKILVIILAALLLRWLAGRFINRITRVRPGRTPAILKPLKDRAPERIDGGVAAERRRQRAETLGSVLRSVAGWLIIAIAALQILSELGVDLAPLLASAGVVGVALGFGAQNLVKDFLAGIFMMLEDQYGVGDTVDLGDAIGTVEAVGLRITTLRDINGTVWYVRNGEVLRVGNNSQGYAFGVVDILLAPGANIDEASRVVTETAGVATSEEPLSTDILAEPELLGVDSITTEGITLRLSVKVKAGTQWSVQRKLRGRIATALSEEGFESPSLRLPVRQPPEA